MIDITYSLNELLTETCLISAGDIDTFSSEAIERTSVFLFDCGVPYTSSISYREQIAIFSWIEYERPQIFAFKFKDKK